VNLGAEQHGSRRILTRKPQRVLIVVPCSLLRSMSVVGAARSLLGSLDMSSEDLTLHRNQLWGWGHTSHGPDILL